MDFKIENEERIGIHKNKNHTNQGTERRKEWLLLVIIRCKLGNRSLGTLSKWKAEMVIIEPIHKNLLGFQCTIPKEILLFYPPFCGLPRYVNKILYFSNQVSSKKSTIKSSGSNSRTLTAALSPYPICYPQNSFLSYYRIIQKSLYYTLKYCTNIPFI